MPGTARDDGPDVDDGPVADYVVDVIAVHGARRVPGHQRHRVAHRQRRAAWRGEDAVLLIEPDDREPVVAHDRDVSRVGDGLAADVHDDPAPRPADDARLDREGVLKARRHVVVVVVHDHIAAGLDLGHAGPPGRPPPGGYPAGGPDPAA